MKTFLSVDIDFWNAQGCFEEVTADKVYSYLDKLCYALKKKRVPMTAVMNHQQMLRMVNDSKANTLINIDQHSDLADNSVQTLNCGTWVSYVKWRRAAGRYLWLHRHDAWYGDCNLGMDSGPIFTEKGRTKRSLSDWGMIQHRKVKSAPSWDWLKERNPIDFSLVLSPHYADPDLEPVFRAIVKEYDIPYLKGTRHEMNARQNVRPPFRQIQRFSHDYSSYDLLPVR